MATMRPRTSFAASRAELPAMTAARLPPEPPEGGLTSVSPWSTRTVEKSTPSSSATICASVVSTLWPLLIELVMTSTVPPTLTRTVVASLDIAPNAIAEGSASREMPMPTRRPSARHCACCARSSS